MDNSNQNNGSAMPPNMQGSQMGMPPHMQQQMGNYPQQMVKPPKQPMDPAKKKRIITIVSILTGLAVVGVALAIILPIVLRVNYSTAYKAAEELQPKISDIYYSYDCSYVVDYLNSTYKSAKDYNEYVEGCKDVYDSETNTLVTNLENTDGVKRNNEIKTQFQKFKEAYNLVSANDPESLSAKLGLWQAWHDFVVAADSIEWTSSNAEVSTAASYLINSGNDTLKAYGEGWTERLIDLIAARRAWTSNYDSGLRDTYKAKDKEWSDWKAANKPDVTAIAPLNFNDASKMHKEFNNLYELIARTYEKNYNSGSGDCSEFLGEVYCD